MSSKNPYNLVNKDNYKKNFNGQKIDNYIKCYANLIKELFNQASNGINIQNKSYHKYIIIKGIQTLTYIFLLLAMHIKNIDMIDHHCQKSIIYYIEFIGQIGDTNHSFLQLSSTDASVFLYRKTIYDINNDYRKVYDINDNINDKIFLDNYNIYINIINKIINYYIEYFINDDNWDNNYKIIINNFIKIENCVLSLYKNLNNNKDKDFIFKKLNKLIDFLITFKVNINNILDILNNLNKKKINKLNYEITIKKIYNYIINNNDYENENQNDCFSINETNYNSIIKNINKLIIN